MSLVEIVCDGCGLKMPKRHTASYDGYYNTSPECWEVYTEVLSCEYGNAFLFGRVHQLTVDTYAVQHAGGKHPDKSTTVHLVGLHLQLDFGLQPTTVPPMLQRLAGRIDTWPHFEHPEEQAPFTVCDVALAGSVEQHIRLVRNWAGSVWKLWKAHHNEIRTMALSHLQIATSVKTTQTS